MFKCFFNHEYKNVITLRQKMTDYHDDKFIGYEIYILKKCSKCKKEKGFHYSISGSEREISPDYIKALKEF